ncbi:hypothetical protein [Pseudomonas rhodesiae]|uniref:hypothetical protein n=2 Tax=Pseudomonas rhodesiae TaxID=76760 RepID=UPI0024DFACAB|nr:hypothetical protein [Pseudomonas rhodesiae]WHT78844.1 hypothetical protein QMY54_03638 [Pseudomonas rhodesiae]
MSKIASGTFYEVPSSVVPMADRPSASTPSPTLSRARRSTTDSSAALSYPWTRKPVPSSNGVAAADTLLEQRLTSATQSGHGMVEVPEGSTLTPLLALYRHLLNQPPLQTWLNDQGLETATLTLHHDFIEGFVTREGVRSAVRFTYTDASGWLEASASLRPLLHLLDPGDKGLTFMGEDDEWVPLAVVEQAKTRHSFHVGDVDSAWRVIGQIEQRRYLADTLEAALGDWPDATPMNWSEHPCEVSPALTLGEASQAARERLQRLVAQPSMTALLEREGFDWPGKPFRITEGRLERLSPVGGWVDLTRYVEQHPALEAERQALVGLSEPLGGAVYSTPRHDVRQLVEYLGLGSMATAGETRNVIHWLRTYLPPAPPLGDYNGLMRREWAPGTLTPEDRLTLTDLAQARLGGSSARGFSALAHSTPQALHTDPQAHLTALLESPEALAFGAQLARALNWFGASGAGYELPKTVCQQLVVAAIKLHAGIDAPDKPGHVAGYSVYQPANMGRTFSAVRRDIEQHLIAHKAVDPKLAVLAAHLGLAQAAPEFLVKDVPGTVHIGTPAWMELRLGCAMADQHAPGTSRAMNEEQVTHLTTLGPTSDAQAELMQLSALKIMADWGVLNGVVRLRSDGEYSRTDIQTASEAFFKQREEASLAFTDASAELPTRRTLAIKELLRVFPDTTPAGLEAMTVHIAEASERRNMASGEPRTRPIIEAYITGDLTPGKWALSSDLRGTYRSGSTPYQQGQAPQASPEARAQLDQRIRRLPALDGLLNSAVDRHRHALQNAYATRLKLMLAELPLADRQALELGTVELFTLRGETGTTQARETASSRLAQRGRQGTVMRLEHNNQVTYYELFANGNVVRRTDLPQDLILGGLIKHERFPAPHGHVYLPVNRGTPVPFDADAYTLGTAPRSDVASPAMIIEQLGTPFAASALPASYTPQNYVPNTYGSRKTARIVEAIAQGNFYESPEALLQRATEQVPLERSREARTRAHNFLLGFVPFVGAYQEFKAGNIGSGLANLAVDTVGVAIGAAGPARGLIRSAKALAFKPLKGIARRLTATVSPMVSTTARVKPAATFSDRAFDFLKHSGLFANAALNPLDGYPQMIRAATKGLFNVPKLILQGTMNSGKVAPHLLTAEEKLRSYLIIAAGQIDRQEPGGQSPVGSRTGVYRGAEVQSVRYGGHWYALDPLNGRPVGTPLSEFVADATP